MGNEFSWPCTDRKAQKRRLRESRYDQTLFEYATPRDSESDIPNLLEVESIVSQQRKYPKNPVATNSLATTKSSSGKTQHEFQENFDDLEGNDDFLPLLLTSRNMQPFDNFIRDLKTIYESKFVPITICAHPFRDESIVVLQLREKYNNFRMSKLTKFTITRSKKTFKISASLLEEIIAYMSAKNQEGLSFIGYYIPEQTELLITFQFVYLHQEQHNTLQILNFEFEVLKDKRASKVGKILTNRTKKNYNFRGSISIPNYNGTAFAEGENLHVMIFEKVIASYNYHTIEIPKSDLSSEALVTRVSKYISDFCESKKLDFSGVITNEETGTIIVILAT